MIEGGCFCGQIRYAIEHGDYRVANCHCSMCRKTSAAAYVTWLVVPRRDFAYTQGTPSVLQSSAHGTRHFCQQCGTPLVFFETDRPDTLDVTVGSLDQPESFAPQKNVFEETRLSWVVTTP